MHIRQFLAAALVGVLVSGPAWADKGKLYTCVTEDVRELSDDGKLFKDGDTVRLYIERVFPRFTFDLATGVLRTGTGDSTPRKMEIIEKGSRVNDIVALRTYQGTDRSGLNVFSIRIWKPEMPFLFLHGGAVLTGRCRSM